MKKILLLSLLFAGFARVASAQTKQHKVVFEMTTSDTADHRTILRQVNNALRDVPGTMVEIVCHGPAIFMLVKDKTVLSDMMQELKTKQNVVFAACANSMKKNNLDKSQLVDVATVVPNGVMEVVTKEEEGWSYIKGGH